MSILRNDMCYNYALGYNVGYNIGCYDDMLENIDKENLSYFNEGYQQGISDYCAYVPKYKQSIDQVVYQIEKDIENGDVTAIEELLKYVQPNNLKSFLSEA